MNKLAFWLFNLALLLLPLNRIAGGADRPNVVIVLADDLGYGDPACYNPESKIPTPSIDRLAEEGVRFTDAHSPGAWCVPSRYGLLTGRYPYRTQLDWRARSIIDSGSPTIATLLRDAGYRTAMVGKWHQGLDSGPDYDGSTVVKGGPLDHGFDTYYGIPASLDIPPYYYIRDRDVVAAPSAQVGANASPGWSPIQGAFWREGKAAPGFRHDEVLPRLVFESARLIESFRESRPEQPFFLYVALTAPHTPWLPLGEFEDRGGAGLYSAFVAQVDDAVGRILAALEQGEADQETVVVFTSDNGPVWYPADTERLGHSSSGPLRGMKADGWEGGHRIPFILRWPGKASPGRVSDQLISFVDVMATLADILDIEMPEVGGEDSISFLPAVLGQSSTESRRELIVKEDRSVFRQGEWKLITHLGSGGFSEPRKFEPSDDGPTGQLYNLSEDLGEENNRWREYPERVKQMLEILEGSRNQPADRNPGLSEGTGPQFETGP